MHFVFDGIFCHFTFSPIFMLREKRFYWYINCPKQTETVLVYRLTLLDLLLTEAFIIPPNADNLYLRNLTDLKHPFFRNLEKMACLVLGKALASSSIYPVGSRTDYEILVRRYRKTGCTTCKEVV